MAKGKGKHNGRGHLSGPKKYEAYMFRTKDPVIDEVRTIVQDTHGKCNYKALRKVADAGGPSVGAMTGWLTGKTMRPNNASVEAAGRAMGRKRVWVAHRPNTR